MQRLHAAESLRLVANLLFASQHGEGKHRRGERPEGLAMTPLHWAAGWGNLGTVRALVGAGADRNVRNGAGRTPAEEAVHRGKLRSAAWLLDLPR